MAFELAGRLGVEGHKSALALPGLDAFSPFELSLSLESADWEFWLCFELGLDLWEAGGVGEEAGHGGLLAQALLVEVRIGVAVAAGARHSSWIKLLLFLLFLSEGQG